MLSIFDWQKVEICESPFTLTTWTNESFTFREVLDWLKENPNEIQEVYFQKHSKLKKILCGNQNLNTNYYGRQLEDMNMVIQVAESFFKKKDYVKALEGFSKAYFSAKLTTDKQIIALIKMSKSARLIAKYALDSEPVDIQEIINVLWPRFSQTISLKQA